MTWHFVWRKPQKYCSSLFYIFNLHPKQLYAVLIGIFHSVWTHGLDLGSLQRMCSLNKKQTTGLHVFESFFLSSYRHVTNRMCIAFALTVSSCIIILWLLELSPKFMLPFLFSLQYIYNHVITIKVINLNMEKGHEKHILTS